MTKLLNVTKCSDIGGCDLISDCRSYLQTCLGKHSTLQVYFPSLSLSLTVSIVYRESTADILCIYGQQLC